MNKSKKWLIVTISCVCILLSTMALLTIILDPYFHYHAPLEGWEYSLYNERYQNNGIAKHFEYDAIITGSSMSENFKTSEFEQLFGMKAIKIPFFGGSYKEINDQICRAIDANKDIKIIIRSMDYSMLIKEKDFQIHYGPEYLYDDEILNDVNYLLNKEIFLGGTVWLYEKRLLGTPSITFDEYANWMYYYTFGKDVVLADYDRLDEREKEVVVLTEKEKRMIRENVEQNIVDVALENPDTTFYVFITPYSALYWDDLNQKNEIQKHIEAERIAIEEILVAPNIKLFSFSDNFDITCDISLYRDIAHYGESVNSKMLEWMRNGEYQITKDNYEDYLDRIETFYTNYNYEGFFE